MHLTPREFDKLVIHMMADVAHKRQAKGLKLNHPEAVAVLCAYVLEQAREGKTVEEVMDGARSVLKSSDVMDGVPDAPAADPGRSGVHGRQPAGQPPQPDHLKAAGKNRLNGQRGGDSMAKARKVAGRKVAALHPQPGHENVPHKAVRPIGGYVLSDEPDRAQPGAAAHHAQGAQHGRPADPGRLAFPFLRGQPLSRVRPPRRFRPAARHPGQHRRPLRARRREAGDAGAVRRQAASSTASTTSSTAGRATGRIRTIGRISTPPSNAAEDAASSRHAARRQASATPAKS